MIIDIPSNLKLPPNFLYNKGVSGRFNVEFESDFDAVVYFAGKSPIAKGKTQKPLMEWLMSLGISFDDIKSHRNKILDVIRQLTDNAQDSNYVTVPPIPQSFSVKPVKDKKEESKSEGDKNLDNLLKSIREEDDSEGGKKLDDLLDSIRDENPKDKKIDPNKLLSVKTFKNPLIGQKFVAPSIKSSSSKIKAEQLKSAVKIEPEKLIPGDENANEELIEKINELIFVIKADNDLEKSEQDYERNKDQKEKREKREKRIELKKIFGVDKVAKSAINKVQGIFDSILRFLGFTLLGQLIKFVTNFLKNPKNKEFIDNTINFVKSIPEKFRQIREKIQPVIDWFTKTVEQVREFAGDFKELLDKNPFIRKIIGIKEDKEPRPSPEYNLFVDPDTGAGKIPSFKSGFGFRGGGMLPFVGTDTVPAMLTPGEIVMSRPAVNYWGADNLLAMNKAGGGTNRPKYGLISGYQGGGFVNKMGMTESQFEIYKKEVAKIESKGSGGYSARGGANNHYDGKYQMGEVAKKDAARFLGEPFPGHDPAARAAFRADPEMQERYFKAYTYANYNYMLKDPIFKSASPERKLAIMGYAHNQGWAKALDWLNTGEVGRDAFGTAGTKYVNAIEEAFKIKSSAPQPPVLPPPGLPAIENKTELEKVGDNFKFIFDSIRNLLPVGTPNVPTSSKIIVLPPIKQQAQQPTTTQTSNEIPDFKVSSGVKMRGLVGKALGIEDLVS